LEQIIEVVLQTCHDNVTLVHQFRTYLFVPSSGVSTFAGTWESCRNLGALMVTTKLSDRKLRSKNSLSPFL